jgi:hypothetical protein
MAGALLIPSAIGNLGEQEALRGLAVEDFLGGVLMASGDDAKANPQVVAPALADFASPDPGCPDPGFANEIRNLPRDPNDLVKNGWTDVTDPRQAINTSSREFLSPNTGLKVRFDPAKPGASPTKWEGRDHYHAYNPNKRNKNDKYLDMNCRPVGNGSDPSHLAPWEN